MHHIHKLDNMVLLKILYRLIFCYTMIPKVFPLTILQMNTS